MDAATVKGALEALSTVGDVDVARSPPDAVGGHSWTIRFLEDGARTHRGDLPVLGVTSALTAGAGSGVVPTVTVTELRKGTSKEVQAITVAAGGPTVDPVSSFRLRFRGEETEDILALPLDGTTCLGSKTAKQVIRTSTEDTSGEGGDETVSLLTAFTLSYESYTTGRIKANSGTCADKASVIEEELGLLPPLYLVSVQGRSSGKGDEGCVWTVTFESVVGNPDLLQGENTQTYIELLDLFSCLLLDCPLQ